MDIKWSELLLSAMRVGDRDWPEYGLRDRERVAVYFTEVRSLGGTSVLVAAPKDHVFCSMPASIYSCGFGHAPEAGSGNRRQWLEKAFMRPGIEQDFLRELRHAGIAPSKLRYGLLPYVGGTSAVRDLGYGKRLPVLWQQWFRNYLIPHGGEAERQFLVRLAGVLDERATFACRPFLDANVPADVATHFDEGDTREEALLWSYYTWGKVDPRYRPFEVQERAIELLRATISHAERGKLPLFDSFSPAFDDHTVRIVLADAKPQTIGHFNAELISSYRVRLARLTAWPTFALMLASVPARMRLRRAQFDPPQRDLPYDIVREVDAYLEEAYARFPSYVHDPLDQLYVRG